MQCSGDYAAEIEPATVISGTLIQGALERQGGALKDEAVEISEILSEAFDTASSLWDVELADITEVMVDGGVKCQRVRAKRILAAFKDILDGLLEVVKAAKVGDEAEREAPGDEEDEDEESEVELRPVGGVSGQLHAADLEVKAAQPKTVVDPDAQLQQKDKVAKGAEEASNEVKEALARAREGQSEDAGSEETVSRSIVEVSKLMALTNSAYKEQEELQTDVEGRPKVRDAMEWVEEAAYCFKLVEPGLEEVLQLILEQREWSYSLMGVQTTLDPVINSAFGTVLRRAMPKRTFKTFVKESPVYKQQQGGLQIVWALMNAAAAVNHTEVTRMLNELDRVHPVPQTMPETMFERYEEWTELVEELQKLGGLRVELGDGERVKDSACRLLQGYSDIEVCVSSLWYGAGTEVEKLERIKEAIRKKAVALSKGKKKKQMTLPQMQMQQQKKALIEGAAE